MSQCFCLSLPSVCVSCLQLIGEKEISMDAEDLLSFKPLTLVKGCSWVTCNLIVHFSYAHEKENQWVLGSERERVCVCAIVCIPVCMWAYIVRACMRVCMCVCVNDSLYVADMCLKEFHHMYVLTLDCAHSMSKCKCVCICVHALFERLLSVAGHCDNSFDK